MSSQDMMVCAAYKHELANNTNIPEYVLGWIQSRIKQLPGIKKGFDCQLGSKPITMVGHI